MPSVRQYRYYWGVMLEELCDNLGVDSKDRGKVKKMLHWMFKHYFKLKTTTLLPPALMEDYLNHVRILCNTEWGIMLHEPNEADTSYMDMEEFLAYKLH